LLGFLPKSSANGAMPLLKSRQIYAANTTEKVTIFLQRIVFLNTATLEES